MRYEDLTDIQKKSWRVVNGYCYWCSNSQMMLAVFDRAVPIDCPKCGANPSTRKPALIENDDK